MSQETQPLSRGKLPTIQEAVTFRSIAVGIGVILLSETYITWGMMLLASRMNKSYWPMGLFFVYAVLVLFNAALARSKKEWSLRKEELQVVLAMGLIGAFFPFFGLAAFVLPTIAAPFYLDTAENGM